MCVACRLVMWLSSFRFPGTKKAVGSYGPAGGAAAAKKDEDDDDFDLFGSDDEDAEAAAKLKEERIAAYAAKKSKSMYHPKKISFKSVFLYATNIELEIFGRNKGYC